MPKLQDDISRAVQLTSAYASNNKLTVAELPELLDAVFSKIVEFSQRDLNQVPAVSIEESVTDDYLICLEDGEKVTLLKRYLQRHHNMTPEQYLEKWNLPADYPFVAKSYSNQRSRIAKKHQLGKTKV